jgi:hypothetical protein
MVRRPEALIAMPTIKTSAPNKGDLVPGHKVYAFFPDTPAIPATVVSASQSGHEVVIEFQEALTVLFDLPLRTEWTWRDGKPIGSYQQKGAKTKKGVGLALVRKPAPPGRKTAAKRAGLDTGLPGKPKSRATKKD